MIKKFTSLFPSDFRRVFVWNWRMIIIVNFPIWAIGKKKPEKIRASMGFEPIAPVSRRSLVQIPLKAWFFQASSFQLLKFGNLMQWSFFTFIYNCSSNMNYFTYTSHKIREIHKYWLVKVSWLWEILGWRLSDER